MRRTVEYTLFILVLLCAAPRVLPADDFQVATATYLGGPAQEEEWTAVDVAPDGAVVVAGSLPESEPGDVRPVDLLGGGYGIVVRLNPQGTKVLSATRMGDYIDDLEVGEDGRIAATGSFGVAVLSAGGSSLDWRDGDVIRGTKAAQFRNQTPPFKHARYTRRVARVAVGVDGTVASIQNDEKVHGTAPKMGHLYVWDPQGRRLCDVALRPYKYPKDVCVSAAHKLVIVGGLNTYSADSRHMKNHPIHMPFLVAYDYQGNKQWESYNFPAAASYAQNTFADSRVQRITIGRDGYLYMGGYVHGGDYVWRHDPHDVTKRSDHDTGYDSFSRAANMGPGRDHAYFAKFDPADGKILLGQPLLCRATEAGGGKPGQIQIKGIHADKSGNVYLSGYCEKYIKNRSAQRINGTAVGPYHAPEAFLMVVSPDFRTRKVWTVFSQHCESASWGVSVRCGTAALVAELYEGTMITTEGALQAKPGKPYDGYLMTWQPHE